MCVTARLLMTPKRSIEWFVVVVDVVVWLSLRVVPSFQNDWRQILIGGNFSCPIPRHILLP